MDSRMQRAALKYKAGLDQRMPGFRGRVEALRAKITPTGEKPVYGSDVAEAVYADAAPKVESATIQANTVATEQSDPNAGSPGEGGGLASLLSSILGPIANMGSMVMDGGGFTGQGGAPGGMVPETSPVPPAPNSRRKWVPPGQNTRKPWDPEWKNRDMAPTSPMGMSEAFTPEMISQFEQITKNPAMEVSITPSVEIPEGMPNGLSKYQPRRIGRDIALPEAQAMAAPKSIPVELVPPGGQAAGPGMVFDPVTKRWIRKSVMGGGGQWTS